MAAAAEVQALLRFLTKDAKIPLAEAMSKINVLRKQQFNTPESISKADEAVLQTVFTDDKVLKQVINAAKRVVNPRKRPSSEASSPASKRVKGESNVLDDEEALALPLSDLSFDEIETTTIETNRAPLFLAFTIAVLAYTHAEQPLSSRWSMAQAVVSAGAQSKAKYLGLTSGPTAEEDGWALGQPKVKIMGREVAVMRRHVVSSSEAEVSAPTTAFWGLDLEALRRSNGPLTAGNGGKRQDGPPIHKPFAARNYLLKSMIVVEQDNSASSEQEKGKQAAKKGTAKSLASKREEAAAITLKAIDTVLQSWAVTLSNEELDQKAQSWYVRVRPDVEHGQAGWGQRGKIQLQDILRLKRG
ncbi:hypothetical protein EDD36DRAFT_144661 [Exophiala viscosa]|uniref:Impact N-terminal domain-containing protein n=1 Tax=Exophiala viscosa TaxID=2486360 RepID=A0AAN6E243_9EURO|nr:hypothetical protein EDD36DRAFT_144661 [Exophiala viscosa]